MRKISVLLVLISISFYSCKKNAASKISDESAKIAKERIQNAADAMPEMTFVSREFEFGTISEGDEVQATFEFQNTGKGDLIITKAKASCGCTIPDWPRNKAIKPGEKGVIKALFKSRGKQNKQNKSITLTTNTATSPEKVFIKGFVTPKRMDVKKSKKPSRNTRH